MEPITPCACITAHDRAVCVGWCKPSDDAFGAATTGCCLCLSATATVYCGHVTHGARRILAGWCQPCRKKINKAIDTRLANAIRKWTIEEFLRCDLAGWHGHWIPSMGLQSWDEIEAMRRALRIPKAGTP